MASAVRLQEATTIDMTEIIIHELFQMYGGTYTFWISSHEGQYGVPEYLRVDTYDIDDPLIANDLLEIGAYIRQREIELIFNDL